MTISQRLKEISVLLVAKVVISFCSYGFSKAENYLSEIHAQPENFEFPLSKQLLFCSMGKHESPLSEPQN